MTNRALHIILTLIVFVMGGVGTSKGELTIQDVLDAHHTTTDSIASIQARVRTKFREKEPHLTELDQEYLYVRQGNHERFTKQLTSPRIVEGEFSRIPFELGRLDVHNGPGGYKRLMGFDGQMDKEGVVPADSPASGVVGPSRKSIEYHWIPFHLGLQPLCPDDSTTEPLRHLCQKADRVSLVERPTKDNHSCYVLDIEMTAGSHRIWLSPEHNFSIRRMDWSGKKRHSFQVNEFQSREGVFICKTWEARQTAENGFAVTMDGFVDLVSLNQPISDEHLFVVFPAGLPFIDQHEDRPGIWGEGKPARMFDTFDEARDWNANRRMAQSPELRKDRGEGSIFRTATMLLAGLVVLAAGSWYAYRYWSTT